MKELKELVKEFFSILDEVEETNSGREFHPVHISSCRVMKTQRLSEIFTEMKKLIKDK